MLFFGLAVGQLFYGPLSDSVGRKPVINLGYFVFILGCILSIFATNMTMMLCGRALQGLGIAGPRTATMALIRDLYEGRAMARIMSFIMTVFILVPMLAPAIGQGILVIANWQAIFGVLLLIAIVSAIWLNLRQPETLSAEKRMAFSPKRIANAFGEVFTNRIAFGYTVTAGLASGAFIAYLSTAQQIFQLQYGLGTRFPLIFAVLSLSLGSASFINARLVMRYGMRRLATNANIIICILSSLFLLIAYNAGGSPDLWMLMTYLMLNLFCIGILFGNLNAMAMEPLGHIAGVGAAVVGSVATLVSTAFGTLIGQMYNETVLPLVGGFAVLSILSLVTMRWAESGTRDSQ